jgi:glycosyltransferase 2 family protein
VTIELSAPPRPARVVTYCVAVVVPAGAVAWIAANRATVDAGTDLLGGAAQGWFVGAFAVAAMTWVAGAVCQQGAVLERLPTGRLLAVQFAGSAANHILPAGLGVATVNMRFLRHRGLSRASALNAVGLNTCAGISVHLLALVVLISTGLAAPHDVSGRGTILLIVAAIVAGTTLALTSVRRLRRRCVTAIREQLRSAATQWSLVGRRPARAVQLWTGSAAVPVLHAVTLACMTQALGSNISVGAVFGVYFLASAVSAAVPSPGGFGSLDAALIVALTAGGLTTATAVAAVIGYRLITVWLPLLPSACVIGVLHHQSVI